MTLCLVTDRHRLAAAVGAPASAQVDTLSAQVAGALEGGVDLVQVREPDLSAAALVNLVRHVLAVVPRARGCLVVNDRLDVALVSGAAGIHLRERSYSPEAARQLAPPVFLVGCSVHDVSAVARRRAADYFIAGTVRPTASKSPERYLGWDGLARVVAAAEGRPVLGIGGLTVGTVPNLAATGAAGLAAIGAFIPEGPDDVGRFARDRAEELRKAIDSTRRVF